MAPRYTSFCLVSTIILFCGVAFCSSEFNLEFDTTPGQLLQTPRLHYPFQDQFIPLARQGHPFSFTFLRGTFRLASGGSLTENGETEAEEEDEEEYEEEEEEEGAQDSPRISWRYELAPPTPSWLKLDSKLRAITGTPTEADLGEQDVFLKVFSENHGAGLGAIFHFVIMVSEDNGIRAPPTLTNLIPISTQTIVDDSYRHLFRRATGQGSEIADSSSSQPSSSSSTSSSTSSSSPSSSPSSSSSSSSPSQQSSPTPVMTLAERFANAVVVQGQTANFRVVLHPSTFAVITPSAPVALGPISYTAKTASSTALPAWLIFNPFNLEFTGVPPKGTYAKTTFITIIVGASTVPGYTQSTDRFTIKVVVHSLSLSTCPIRACSSSTLYHSRAIDTEANTLPDVYIKSSDRSVSYTLSPDLFRTDECIQPYRTANATNSYVSGISPVAITNISMSLAPEVVAPVTTVGDSLPSWLVFNTLDWSLSGTVPMTAPARMTLLVDITDSYNTTSVFKLPIFTSNISPLEFNEPIPDQWIKRGDMFNLPLHLDTLLNRPREQLSLPLESRFSFQVVDPFTHTSVGTATPRHQQLNMSTPYLAGTPNLTVAEGGSMCSSAQLWRYDVEDSDANGQQPAIFPSWFQSTSGVTAEYLSANNDTVTLSAFVPCSIILRVHWALKAANEQHTSTEFMLWVSDNAPPHIVPDPPHETHGNSQHTSVGPLGIQIVVAIAVALPLVLAVWFLLLRYCRSKKEADELESGPALVKEEGDPVGLERPPSSVTRNGYAFGEDGQGSRHRRERHSSEVGLREPHYLSSYDDDPSVGHRDSFSEKYAAENGILTYTTSEETEPELGGMGHSGRMSLLGWIFRDPHFPTDTQSIDLQSTDGTLPARMGDMSDYSLKRLSVGYPFESSSFGFAGSNRTTCYDSSTSGQPNRYSFTYDQKLHPDLFQVNPPPSPNPFQQLSPASVSSPIRRPSQNEARLAACGQPGTPQPSPSHIQNLDVTPPSSSTSHHHHQTMDSKDKAEVLVERETPELPTLPESTARKIRRSLHLGSRRRTIQYQDRGFQQQPQQQHQQQQQHQHKNKRPQEESSLLVPAGMVHSTRPCHSFSSTGSGYIASGSCSSTSTESGRDSFEEPSNRNSATNNNSNVPAGNDESESEQAATNLRRQKSRERLRMATGEDFDDNDDEEDHSNEDNANEGHTVVVVNNENMEMTRKDGRLVLEQGLQQDEKQQQQQQEEEDEGGEGASIKCVAKIPAASCLPRTDSGMMGSSTSSFPNLKVFIRSPKPASHAALTSLRPSRSMTQLETVSSSLYCDDTDTSSVSKFSIKSAPATITRNSSSREAYSRDRQLSVHVNTGCGPHQSVVEMLQSQGMPISPLSAVSAGLPMWGAPVDGDMFSVEDRREYDDDRQSTESTSRYRHPVEEGLFCRSEQYLEQEGSSNASSSSYDQQGASLVQSDKQQSLEWMEENHPDIRLASSPVSSQSWDDRYVNRHFSLQSELGVIEHAAAGGNDRRDDNTIILIRAEMDRIGTSSSATVIHPREVEQDIDVGMDEDAWPQSRRSMAGDSIQRNCALPVETTSRRPSSERLRSNTYPVLFSNVCSGSPVPRNIVKATIGTAFHYAATIRPSMSSTLEFSLIEAAVPPPPSSSLSPDITSTSAGCSKTMTLKAYLVSDPQHAASKKDQASSAEDVLDSRLSSLDLERGPQNEYAVQKASFRKELPGWIQFNSKMQSLWGRPIPGSAGEWQVSLVRSVVVVDDEVVGKDGQKAMYSSLHQFAEKPRLTLTTLNDEASSVKATEKGEGEEDDSLGTGQTGSMEIEVERIVLLVREQGSILTITSPPLSPARCNMSRSLRQLDDTEAMDDSKPVVMEALHDPSSSPLGNHPLPSSPETAPPASSVSSPPAVVSGFGRSVGQRVLAERRRLEALQVEQALLQQQQQQRIRRPK
ncbi:hypothetical protein BG004_003629 [Podila humilis]|nr:hypothetical protein BG004_003629 [Podila humilis]